MQKKILAVLGIVTLLSLLYLPLMLAYDFDDDISADDKATFDEMLEPVMKIYNLVKYSATIIAAIILLFAGISYMISGGDPKKREQAKSMAMYVIIGLIIIWVTPLIVNFIIG